MKSAPDYSSVYVISKDKVVESRPAIVPLGTVVAQSHGIAPCKSENDKWYFLRFFLNVSFEDFFSYLTVIFKIQCNIKCCFTNILV